MGGRSSWCAGCAGACLPVRPSTGGGARAASRSRLPRGRRRRRASRRHAPPRRRRRKRRPGRSYAAGSAPPCGRYWQCVAATEPVAVPREPAVEPLGQRSRERQGEHPGDPAAARQQVEDPLDRRRPLPRAPALFDDLKRIAVRGGRDPREPRLHPGRLRREHLEGPAGIETLEPVRQPRAHPAVAVVDAPRSGRLTASAGAAPSTSAAASRCSSSPFTLTVSHSRSSWPPIDS